MEEIDQNQKVWYSDAPLKNILKRVQRGLANNCGDLSKIVSTSERNSEKFGSSIIQGDDQILYDKNKVMETSFNGSKECSAVGGKNDLVNDSLSSDRNTVASNLSTDDVQASNSKKSPQEATMIKVNILKALQESGKMSVLFTSDTDKDASSSKCNLLTFPKIGFYSDSNSNIPSSNLETSEQDSKASFSKMFADVILGKFPSVANHPNTLNRDFMNCDLYKYPEFSNDSQYSTEMSASLMSANDGINHRQLATKFSEDTDSALNLSLSDANPVPPESFPTSDTNSNFLNPDFNISKLDSEICHSSSNFSDCDQDLKPDKKSPYEFQKAVQDLVSCFDDLQDIPQVASEKYSELDHTLGSDHGRFTVSDEGMENEMSVDFQSIHDDIDYLSSSTCFEDRTEAIKNYLSSINPIPLMDSNNYSEYSNSNLNSPDGDKESYHSDLMFSCSDNESNTNKRSYDLQEVVAAEAISSIGLPSDNDKANFIGAHETKDEFSTNSISADDEACIIKALIHSEDPETALNDYFSSKNSVKSKALNISNLPLEYCKDNEPNANKRSYDLQEVVAAEAISSIGHPSDNDQANFVGAQETKDLFSTNSITADDEACIIEALIRSDDPETALNDYFSRKNSVQFKVLKIPSLPLEYCHSDFRSSDSIQDSNPNEKSNEILQALSKVKNLMNSTAQFHGLVQEAITETRLFSGIESTSDNDEVNVFGSHETKPNYASNNTDDEGDRPEALICSEVPETAFIDYLSSRNSKPFQARIFPGNVSENKNSDSLSSDTFIERSCALNVGKELKKISNAFQAFFQEQNYDNTSSKIGLLSEDDRIPSHRKRKNEVSETCDTQNHSKLSEERKHHIKRFFPSHSLTREDSETFESGLKFSNREREMSSFKPTNISNEEEALENLRNRKVGMKRKTDDSFELISYPDNIKKSSIDCAETEDDNIETIDEIFKKVIKFHPIKKFEIPPYASANTEERLENFDDHFLKSTSGATLLHDTKEHRNVSECFSNVDSPSIMTFDITDCFSQNSIIICNGLIREYLNISAKVNLLLVKNIRNISSKEYESRIHSLNSIDDELGYVNAKVMTTINDWVKQFQEINDNVVKSGIGSRGLYHMTLLEICVLLGVILFRFTLEKQLELEDYEKALIFHHNRSN